MLWVSGTVVASWLCSQALFCESVAAGSVWNVLDTESMPNRSVSYDDYSADVPGIIFTETQSNDRTAARGGSVDVTVSANFASSSLRTEEDFPAEPAQVTAESEPLHIKKGRRGIRLGSAAALSIAVPFFFLILGLLAVRSLRVPAGLKPQEESLGQEEQQSQLQQQGQKH